MTVDKDRLIKKLEHVGEHVVRENLENGVYGPKRRGLVEEWLEQFEEDIEPEQLSEEVDEGEVDPLASEAIEVPDAGPTKKWYQRLFTKQSKDAQS